MKHFLSTINDCSLQSECCTMMSPPRLGLGLLDGRHHDSRPRHQLPHKFTNHPEAPQLHLQQWAGSGTTPPPPDPNPKTPSTVSTLKSATTSSANPPSSPPPPSHLPLPQKQPIRHNQNLSRHPPNTATATPTSGSSINRRVHKRRQSHPKSSSRASSRRTNGAKGQLVVQRWRTARMSNSHCIIATNMVVLRKG